MFKVETQTKTEILAIGIYVWYHGQVYKVRGWYVSGNVILFDGCDTILANVRELESVSGKTFDFPYYENL